MKKSIVLSLCVAILVCFFAVFVFYNKPTVKDAGKIEIGMTYEQVIDILGDDGEDIGSGMMIYKFDLIGFKEALIWFDAESRPVTNICVE